MRWCLLLCAGCFSSSLAVDVDVQDSGVDALESRDAAPGDAPRDGFAPRDATASPDAGVVPRDAFADSEADVPSGPDAMVECEEPEVSLDGIEPACDASYLDCIAACDPGDRACARACDDIAADECLACIDRVGDWCWHERTSEECWEVSFPLHCCVDAHECWTDACAEEHCHDDLLATLTQCPEEVRCPEFRMCNL